MRFWDTSAVVPLLILEPATPIARESLVADPDIAAWWGTSVECMSALARHERRGTPVDEALARLDVLSSAWLEITASDRLRRAAWRLSRVHPLRAADALQLAAASIASEQEPQTLPFVTLDERLASAASREGFPVVRPS